MRIKAWRVAPVALLVNCAGRTEAPTAGQSTPWQHEMEQARRLAAAGRNHIVSGPSGVIVFYNNPHPSCYTYMIPGDWVVARQVNAYRSRDGRAFAGVLFSLARDLDGLQGATLVERAATSITQGYQKALGQELRDVELVPLPSARPGTWRWRAGPVTQGTRSMTLPAKIIVGLDPDGVAQITIGGTPDDDGLARRVIETLRTTRAPECYWSPLERMLKAALGVDAPSRHGSVRADGADRAPGMSVDPPAATPAPASGGQRSPYHHLSGWRQLPAM